MHPMNSLINVKTQHIN